VFRQAYKLKSNPDQIGRIEFQEFRKALAELPSDQREALMLRDWTLKLVPEIVKKDLPGNTPAAGGEGSSSEPVAAATH